MATFARRTWFRVPILICLALATGWLGTAGLSAQTPDEPAPTPTPTLTRSHQGMIEDRQAPWDLEALSAVPCQDGFADIYPCRNVDLLSVLPLGQIGGGSGNDIWGWTDPLTGSEYALMGRTTGTAFVDITDPENPVYLGNLPTHSISSSWRDIKVFADHAFVVADLAGEHGMQVFDLTRLRNVPSPPVTFTEDANYMGSGFSTAHNIAINERTGFAYLVGSDTCAGGLHMVNIQNPTNPTFAGCYSGDGYTHDTQCVIYRGVDAEHRGKEICFSSNEDTVTIVDVTNKSAPVMLSRTSYPGVGYTHQGWLTPNHRIFAIDDELDEVFFGHNTRTRFFDVADLEAPVLRVEYTGRVDAIDHNLYWFRGLVFEANYRSGLRIIRPGARPREVAFFDIYPADDAASFNGAWSNYPFFRSGVVVVSGIEQGLFVLRPTI